MRELLRDLKGSLAGRLTRGASGGQEGLAYGKQSAGDATGKPDAMRAPVVFSVDGVNVRLKIDRACRFNGSVVVWGWSDGPVSLALKVGEVELDSRLFPHQRADVAQALGSDGKHDFGFALLASSQQLDGGELTLVVDAGQSDRADAYTFAVRDVVDEVSLPPAPELLAVLSKHFVPLSSEWHQIVAAFQSPTDHGMARGFIEAIRVNPATGCGVVIGWVAKLTAEGFAWLEDEEHRTYSLTEAYRLTRTDVSALFGGSLQTANGKPGFIMPIGNSTIGSAMKLKAFVAGRVHVLAEAKAEALESSPVQVMKWLCAHAGPMSRFAEYCEKVVLPVTSTLLEHEVVAWAHNSVWHQTYGEPLCKPLVSLIIPLYGNLKFIEHQLLEFARDPWLRDHCELVYVLDDPGLLEAMQASAPELEQMYGMPLHVVWGEANRGFSGANNLGAAYSRGEYLLFLNSDVFPQQAGWVQAMLGTLQETPDAGLVAPRLLFADGSIQHAGMRAHWKGDISVWLNRHPNSGLDPKLDVHRTPAELPSVTGACILISRKIFSKIDGWDTGYLIGDFEDSDFCYKVRSCGYKVIYTPEVQLIHLERQTFSLLGHAEFRTKVTLLNAVRHQKRWSEIMIKDDGNA